ncbi:MAG: IPT/TIG domain-containing protein [Candidatus Riflebacteria bacterium]|nr:IPT/TIG domain-containing protein [Candidatus Riflebacteria bacterium]
MNRIHIANQGTSRYFFCLILVSLIITLLIGCGGGSGGSYNPGTSVSPGSAQLSTEGIISGIITTNNLSSSLKALSKKVSFDQTSSGTPIPNADVWISELPQKLAKTDSTGHFSISGIPFGSNFKIVARYKIDQEGNTLIARSQSISLSTTKPAADIGPLLLQPGVNSISGILKDQYDKPVINAELTLWGIKFTTDSSGKFITPSLPYSIASDEIIITSPGLKDTKVPIVFSHSTTSSLVELSIPPVGEINIPPVIFISSAPDTVSPQTEVKLQVEIFDPDELDPNFFKPKWSVTDGTLASTPDPKTIVWRTPSESGLATISVSVIDSRGAKASVHAGFAIGGISIPVIRIASVFPTSGSPGTPVKITGTGFGTKTDKSFVSFNGALSQLVSWSNTTIDTIVPTSAKTGILLISTGDIEKSAGIFSIPEMQVSSIYPTSGSSGTIVKISGNGFGLSSESSSISFNGKQSTFISWNDSEIRTIVPSQANSGMLVVNIRGQEFAPANFVIPDPTLSISPDYGPPLSEFTIRGSDFGGTQESGSSSVFINTVPVDIQSWNDTAIKCKIPATSTSGIIAVKTHGSTLTAGIFTISRVFSVSSTKGTIGTELVINGEGFGPSQNGAGISFANKAAFPIKSWSAGQISGIVPSQASSGQITGTIQNIDFRISDFNFSAVNNISIIGGKPGDPIDISGIGFGATQGSGKVLIGGLAAPVINWSDTSIRITIPDGATSGPLSVMAGDLKTNETTLYIIFLNSIFPIYGFSGTHLILSGNGFGSNIGSVLFGETLAKQFVSWSDNRIELVVPDGISGTQDVVVSNTSNRSNSQKFAVTEFGSIDKMGGWTGLEVTITGRNFGIATPENKLLFNSHEAPIIQWTDSSIVSRVPLNSASGPLILKINGYNYTVGTKDFTVVKNLAYEAVVPAWSGPRNKSNPQLTCAAIASNGNILVSDYDNNWIWQYDSTGKYLGKMGTEGNGNAQFYLPWGITFDSAGNIFIADSGNDRIQKFSGNGDFLGWFGRDTKGTTGWHPADSPQTVPTYGNQDGEFKSPTSLAINSSGDLYIADTGNHRIQKLKGNGDFVKSIGKIGAANGNGDGEFNYPGSVSFDSKGNLFVADTGNHRIQVFDQFDSLQYWFGQDDANATGTHTPGSGRTGKRGNFPGMFDSPNWVNLNSSDTIFVADTNNNRIQSFDSNAQFINEIGQFGSGLGQYQSPVSVIFSGGSLFIADMTNSRVQVVDPNNIFLKSIEPDTSGLNTDPTKLAVDQIRQLLYVVDTGDPQASPESSVNVFDLSGNFIRKLGSFGSGAGQFRFPRGIAVDSSGNVYVADSKNARIQKFNQDGAFLKKWGAYGTGDGQFSLLQQVAIDSSGNFIYAIDSLGNRVQKFTLNGDFISKWGKSGSGDGEFNHPIDLAIDSSGTVYIVDTDNNRIQKFTPDGALIGWWGADTLDYVGWHNPGSQRTAVSGYLDGAFQQPSGIAIDIEGSVYVLDPANKRIQLFSSNQAVGDIAGLSQTISLDFDSFGIALDAGRRIYITRSDKLIQKFVPKAN